MDTKYGPIIEPSDFEGPFDAEIKDLLDEGYIVCESLRVHMQPPWNAQPIEILIVDNPLLNAKATVKDGVYRIYIFRGTLERIYGTALGLLSLPEFLPAIGDISVETAPRDIAGNQFPPVPLLRGKLDHGQEDPILLPNDQTRFSFAVTLTDVAFRFLLYHEIGHLVAGHLELARNRGMTEPLSEFHKPASEADEPTLLQVLECDADAFACDLSSQTYTEKNLAVTLHNIIGPPQWKPEDFALIVYMTGIGVLFRVMYPHARAITSHNSSHPHPAVRACLVASSTAARTMFRKSATVRSIAEIMQHSVGELEAAWGNHCLAGQNPEPPETWGKSVQKATMQLFAAYRETRHLLGKYAHLPRRWDSWQWPDT